VSWNRKLAIFAALSACSPRGRAKRMTTEVPDVDAGVDWGLLGDAIVLYRHL